MALSSNGWGRSQESDFSFSVITAFLTFIRPVESPLYISLNGSYWNAKDLFTVYVSYDIWIDYIFLWTWKTVGQMLLRPHVSTMENCVHGQNRIQRFVYNYTDMYNSILAPPTIAIVALTITKWRKLLET